MNDFDQDWVVLWFAAPDVDDRDHLKKLRWAGEFDRGLNFLMTI
jgi:hypothetical protein